jgi:hypothetical protein
MSTQISTKTIVQDEGTTVLSNDIINFTGTGVTVSSVGGAAQVDIPGNVPSTSYGLYAQTTSSIPATGIAKNSIIGTGVGTLTVPANSFQIGDSFTCELDGFLSCLGTATLHIHVETLAGVILADTGIINMDATTSKSWLLNLFFTVRNIGGAGVASISSGGLFSYIKNAGVNFEGYVLSQINATTFDTTVNNTLVVTAQWNTGSASNTIQSFNFVLQKVY